VTVSVSEGPQVSAVPDSADQAEPSDKMISRAIGEELRRVREALGWSRLHLVSLLPSGIGDRTLLSYEHGTRHLTTVRLVELCRAMEVDASTLLTRALQRARIHLTNLILEVDLRTLLLDQRAQFRPLVQWARNALNMHPDGVMPVEPAAVRNLALFVGCTYHELANHLARFIPDYSHTN
jgi:transcriptional regulator with XRE-family HTH domain